MNIIRSLPADLLRLSFTIGCHRKVMARPLRIEYPGALYHVTSRGDRQEAIFEDDHDRRAFLNLLGQVVSQVSHPWSSLKKSFRPTFCQ
jgi:hypothetical protein